MDRWGFSPLHEAAQKGRTQLCALLLAHGADPCLTNQEGQTPLDLATAEDVRCLLQDAMPHLAGAATTVSAQGNGTAAGAAGNGTVPAAAAAAAAAPARKTGQ